LDTIDRVLYKLIGSNVANRNKYNIYRIKKDWEVIAGKHTSLHCCPKEIRLKVLYVDVDCSSWSNELMMHKGILLDKINECLGTNRENGKKTLWMVKDIRFSTREKIKRFKVSNKFERKEEKLSLPELSLQEVKQAYRMLPEIENREVKEEACRINKLRLRRKKYLEKEKIKRCRKCGSPIWQQENELCIFCEQSKKNEERRKIAIFIRKEPWITFDDLQVKYKCDKISFISVKNSLKEYYYSRVEEGTATKHEEDMAVMLKKECPYEKIEMEQREFILRSIRGKEHVRTFGRKLYNKK